ncbi:putative toxin-antitoxin system toxin component, PIN family [Spirosoma oryzicola]|uniref:putative toxin-antitoxin system toxin component, PIN family n=1 Tax=Spirosoma oryzicola TaxID=2898794 RepID=UPI001E3E2A75|nr:putative toxin-antitoxin system toxin component, PIN family [Spirosoma oryzicola]UHG90772.1 putative toxin-antitoxin system toxin component, PIN family [Spirosoma oryzicola]
MRIVLDTNCLLAITPKISPFRPIFDAFRSGKFELAVSSEILTEYHEIAGQKMTPQIAENIIELILKQDNTVQTEIFYRWQLITIDPDDNKFVDTAISSGADYIVTNDAHFRALRDIPFPKVAVISIQDFLSLLQTADS